MGMLMGPVNILSGSMSTFWPVSVRGQQFDRSGQVSCRSGQNFDRNGQTFHWALGHLMSIFVKNEKNKSRFYFLTGSERFLGDFEKINFSTFLLIFSKMSENRQKSIKSNVFGTNARRERDFHV